MKKVRRLFAILLVLILVFASGCGSEPTAREESTDLSQFSDTEESTGVKLPNPSEDFWMLLCGNTNAFVYKEFSSSLTLVYELISVRPLAQEDIQIALGDQNSHEFLFHQIEPSVFPKYVFETYQGRSWEELYDLLLTDEEAFNTKADQYKEAFDALTEEDIPVFHCYDLMIQLNASDFTGISEIKTLTVSVKGEERIYDIGSISVLAEAPDPLIIQEGSSLWAETIGLFDVSITPSENGTIVVPDLLFHAEDDLEITSIRFWGEDIPVNANISSAESGVNVTFNPGDTFPVSSGDTITISVSADDPNFAGAIQGYTQKYLEVQYTSGGVRNAVYTDISFRMKGNSYEVYGALVDHVDILSYYVDFWNKQ